MGGREKEIYLYLLNNRGFPMANAVFILGKIEKHSGKRLIEKEINLFSKHTQKHSEIKAKHSDSPNFVVIHVVARNMTPP